MVQTEESLDKRRNAHIPITNVLIGGEMDALIREFDWAQTPIGSVEFWSPALRTMVSILLANRFPMLLWWGPQYISIYNDAYIPVLGKKHPKALGQPVSECWSEIWHILQPLIDTPFKGGPATWMEDFFLEINRYGFVEETHFTVAYSPVPDETVANGIGGVLATVHEITGKVVGERRVVALRDLGAQMGEAKTAEEACAIAAKTLAGHDKDIPFALLYLIDVDGKRALLAGSAGVGMGEAISPLMVDLSNTKESGWPLAEARQTEAMQVVERLGERFAAVPAGPWFDPPNTAVVVPIPSNKPHRPAGLLVAGVSARLKLDEFYRSFFELVTTQVATAIANARAYEEERKRAEALAELDRAKTAFFSNVSHEFRTPLTLMLGPLEDTLAQTNGLSAEDRARLDVVHRNSLRLLKLVNTLLDFSRIEAGRIQAVYEPTDLAALTTDLASVFRSVIEKAGLTLIIHCPPLAEPVYVDREMWEKIVLNLLSNAFKFTFAGEIAVSLRQAGEMVELVVRDTGTGISAQEMPHLFERFHRVKGAQGRSFEGSGIGLALVQELAKLHGGTVRIESELDRGSTFIVAISLSKAYLPAVRIGVARTSTSTGLRGEVYVEEALHWLPEATTDPSLPRFPSLSRGRAGDRPFAATVPEPIEGQGGRPTTDDAPRVSGRWSVVGGRILLADDNADMREYVRRLLAGQYEVVAVADGVAALEAAREQSFDLVLADVMMPRLDGFELLRELRADEQAKTIPVILLSARAGEELKVEGMEAGADDYLVKPFSARELLARVGAHLELARLRLLAQATLRESERRFHAMIDALPAAIYTTDAEGRLTYFNQAAVELSGRVPELGNDQWCISWKLYYPDGTPMSHDQCPMAIALKEGRTVRGAEAIAERPDGQRIWFEPYPTPFYDSEGRIVGGINMLLDITERKHAEAARAHLAAIVESSDDAIISKDVQGIITSWNKGAEKIFGYTAAEAVGQPVTILIPPRHIDEEPRILERIRRGETIDHYETVRRRKDGTELDISLTVSPIWNKAGKIIGASKIARDITERKRAELERERLLEREQGLRQQAEQANRLKDEFLATVSHELRTPLTSILGYSQRLQSRRHDEAYIARTAEKLVRSAKAQAQLIEDLLDVSRIVSGKLRIEPQLIDLLPVIHAALDTVRPAMEAKGLQLQIDLSPEASTIIGDANRLQQVIWNLLSNATKFTPSGGSIQVWLEPHGCDAQLTVSDTGQGISAAFLPYVFDSFRQAESTSNRAHNGLGLGLAIVRHLVELHGGTVQAMSDGEGQGATFTVRLPLAVNDDATEWVSIATDEDDTMTGCPPELRGLRVLVVDDQPDILELLHDILAPCGVIVRMCGAAQEALSTVRAWQPDVLISDIAMPGDDGYWLIRNVRALAPENGGAIPAVALTAYVRMEERMRVLAAGFQLYVPKPVESSELRAVVASLARMMRDG